MRWDSMRNILLLGADPATVFLYRSHFERAGIALASADLVEPLEDFIRLAQPNALLLDVSHPKTDGEAILRTIRAQPDFKALPVFALTDRQPAHGSGLPLSGSTKSFQKLPSLVPAVVKAVTMALNSPDNPPVLQTDGKSKTQALTDTEQKLLPAPDEQPQNNANLPTLSSETIALVEQLTESFRLFTHAKEEERLETLQKMQEQVKNLRRALLEDSSSALTAFASALARLLVTLSKDLSHVNASCLRTLSAALDVLAAAVADQEHQRQVEVGPARVLVVDDDSFSRRALQFALSCPDLELHEVDTIPSAIERLQQKDFDVIFTDARMLGNGDLTAQIRKLPGGSATIPVVVVTPLPDFDARVQSNLSGSSDVVAKPFAPSELVVKAFTFAFKRRLSQIAPGEATNSSTPNMPRRKVVVTAEPPTEIDSVRSNNGFATDPRQTMPPLFSSPIEIPGSRGLTPAQLTNPSETEAPQPLDSSERTSSMPEEIAPVNGLHAGAQRRFRDQAELLQELTALKEMVDAAEQQVRAASEQLRSVQKQLSQLF